jgi:hypothetical protein
LDGYVNKRLDLCTAEELSRDFFFFFFLIKRELLGKLPQTSRTQAERSLGIASTQDTDRDLQRESRRKRADWKSCIK